MQKCFVCYCRDAEEKIAERIDANLLNVSLEDLANLPKQMYDRKLDRVKVKPVN